MSDTHDRRPREITLNYPPDTHTHNSRIDISGLVNVAG